MRRYGGIGVCVGVFVGLKKGVFVDVLVRVGVNVWVKFGVMDGVQVNVGVGPAGPAKAAFKSTCLDWYPVEFSVTSHELSGHTLFQSR